MPVSNIEYDNLFTLTFSLLKPKSVLDIGSGQGKYGTYCRKLAQQFNIKCQIEAVEPDGEYISVFQLNSLYDTVHNIDAYDIISNDSIRAELVVLGDVLEHIPKSKGVDLLEYLISTCSYVYLVCPFDSPQEAWRPPDVWLGPSLMKDQLHLNERHISIWDQSDFSRYRNACVFSTPTMTASVINGISLTSSTRIKIVELGDLLVGRVGSNSILTTPNPFSTDR